VVHPFVLCIKEWLLKVLDINAIELKNLEEDYWKPEWDYLMSISQETFK
jgi:hypothetical protein